MTSFADLEQPSPSSPAGPCRVRRTRPQGAGHAAGRRLAAGQRHRGALRRGHLWLAGMPRSVTFADLRRDPRMELHSGSDEPAEFSADATVSGRAAEVPDEPTRARFATVAGVPAGQPFELFHVELEQVVLTAVPDDRSALIISSWRPGRGVTRTERT